MRYGLDARLLDHGTAGQLAARTCKRNQRYEPAHACVIRFPLQLASRLQTPNRTHIV